MGVMLEGILSSLTASLIYGTPIGIYAYIQKNKPIEEKLQKAFKNAVEAYFQDERQQGRVIAKDEGKYIELLKNELAGEPNGLESERYKGLYEQFYREIIKDEELAKYILIEQEKLSQKLIQEKSQEILETMSSYATPMIVHSENVERSILQLQTDTQAILANQDASNNVNMECAVYVKVDGLNKHGITIRPKYWKKHYVPKKKHKQEEENIQTPLWALSGIQVMEYEAKRIKEEQKAQAKAQQSVRVITKRINHASCPIELVVANDGKEVIHDLDVFVDIDDSRVTFEESNVKEYVMAVIKKPAYRIKEEGHQLHCTEEKLKVIMEYRYTVYLNIPKEVVGDFTLSWAISAEPSYTQSGKLKIHVDPIYELSIVESDKLAGNPDFIEPYIESM